MVLFTSEILASRLLTRDWRREKVEIEGGREEREGVEGGKKGGVR